MCIVTLERTRQCKCQGATSENGRWSLLTRDTITLILYCTEYQGIMSFVFNIKQDVMNFSFEAILIYPYIKSYNFIFVSIFVCVGVGF